MIAVAGSPSGHGMLEGVSSLCAELKKQGISGCQLARGIFKRGVSPPKIFLYKNGESVSIGFTLTTLN
jgi:hypothetical protein